MDWTVVVDVVGMVDVSPSLVILIVVVVTVSPADVVECGVVVDSRVVVVVVAASDVVENGVVVDSVVVDVVSIDVVVDTGVDVVD